MAYMTIWVGFVIYFTITGLFLFVGVLIISSVVVLLGGLSCVEYFEDFPGKNKRLKLYSYAHSQNQ